MMTLIRRFGMMAATVVASFVWQAFRDRVVTTTTQFEERTWFSQMWPPSHTSAPFCLLVFVAYALYIKRTFFSFKESDEDVLVRQEKKRLILRQMQQALKWDVIEVNEEADGEEKKEKKRPPSAQDLYEMLFDVVEDRHVTEFGIDPNTEPYKSTLALFKERIVEDLRDAARYTKLARQALEASQRSEKERKVEDDITKVDEKTSEDDITKVDLDADDLKFCAQFVDGTKITELIHLCQTKIKKHFGRKFVPKDLFLEAKAIKRELELKQRKGLYMLLPMIAPLLPLYAMAVAFMIFDSSFGALTWHGISAILDGLQDGSMTLPELKLQCLSTWVTLTFCVFSHLTAWAAVHKVTSQFRMRVRSEVMTSIMRQDMMFFDIFPSGLLQERLNNDAETLSNKLFELPMRLVHNTFMVISNACVVYVMKPELFKLIFLPLPVVSLAQYFIIKYMDKLEERQRKIAENSAASTMEVLKEIRTVREFAMEVEEAENFHANSSYRAGLEEFSKALQHIVFIAPMVCCFIGSRVASTYLAGTYVAVQALSVGQAIQVGYIGDHMQHCIRELMMIAPDIVKVLNPLGRVCDMLAKQPKIEPLPTDAPKLKPESFNGHIVFKDVNFTYPSEPQKQILFDLSLEIKPGERVALVGTTGCGKSSTIKLIERFYSPQSGTIKLDGHNIADYDLYHLRRHMSVVAQDNMLFSTTIRENIIYGLPRERRERIQDWEIEEACMKANAWGFVNEFPRKLETYAGERGVKLSGGQKQRLAIARALIRKPSIILLDEATSALDAKAEGVVQKALDGMISANKTGCTIMIAHRLTTIKDCDSIIVMEKGRIVEQGKHEELLAIPIKKSDDEKQMLTGWYHDLWATQMGSDKDGKEEALKERIKSLEEENARLEKFWRMRNSASRRQQMKDLRGRWQSAPETPCKTDDKTFFTLLETLNTGDLPRTAVASQCILETLELSRARTEEKENTILPAMLSLERSATAS